VKEATMTNGSVDDIRHASSLALTILALVALPARALQIELPAETAKLRPGAGSDLATKQCLTCHSADYVSIQPPGKPLAFWKAEVEKMKKVYGAPIPDDQIEPIAQYLTREYGAAP
jgi:sulfite dehydrogenase (cytochrome) subunit B